MMMVGLICDTKEALVDCQSALKTGFCIKILLRPCTKTKIRPMYLFLLRVAKKISLLL